MPAAHGTVLVGPLLDVGVVDVLVRVSGSEVILPFEDVDVEI